MAGPAEVERTLTPVKVLVVGHTPPPFNGMSSATAPLLDLDSLEVSLLVTGNSKLLVTTGVLSMRNIGDAFRVVGRLVLLRPWRFGLAHVPIAQNSLGVLRDSLILSILRLLGVPYVVHLHGGFFDQWYATAPKLLRCAARMTIGHARRGLVLSAGLTHCLQCIMPLKRIVVCENGTAPPCSPRSLRRSKILTVLHIGALTPDKGTVDLIDAVESLEHVHLILAGEAWPEVQEAVDRSKHTRLTGAVSGRSKEALFEEADVVCLPTRYPYEGQPIALLEAMAAGLPVVTTRRAAIADTVGDAGLYVPECDVAAIAAKLSTLRDDPGLRAELGARGRCRYLEHFTAEAYRDRVVATWREVLDEQARVR